MIKATKAIFGAIEELALGTREIAATIHTAARHTHRAVDVYGEHLLDNLDSYLNEIETVEELPQPSRKERLIN